MYNTGKITFMELLRKQIISFPVFIFMISGVSSLSYADGEFRLNNLITFTNKLHISGYGNAHMMYHDGTPDIRGERDLDNPLYQLRELSFFTDLDVTDNITASAEVQFNKLSDTTGVFLNYAYLNFDVSSMLNKWDADKFGNLSMRFGKFLVPFLSYNEHKPNFKQNLMSPPFTARQLAPVLQNPPNFRGIGWSDTGAMLNWNREIGEYGILDFKASVIKGLQSNKDVLDANTVTLNSFATTGTGMEFQPTIRPRDGLMQNDADGDFNDNNNNKAVTAKLSYLFNDLPLDVGFSYYRGAWDRKDDHYMSMYGVHFNYLAKNWTLKGEYVLAEVDQREGINIVKEMGPADINTSTGDYDMEAWYIEGSFVPYRYGKDKDFYLRLIARYDYVDTNDEVAAFNPWHRARTTLGTEWKFNLNSMLRYEWQYTELDDFTDAPDPYKDAGGKEHIKMHMISLVFWF
jgi:hypothetical protein